MVLQCIPMLLHPFSSLSFVCVQFLFVSSLAAKVSADTMLFSPKGFYGGTIKGVISRMPYLVELGITCIWLTPIFASPSHHGYDATDYMAVEPRLGTEQDFRDLISVANLHGVRVVLDFVAHHCSSMHPAFMEAQADTLSATKDWL